MMYPTTNSERAALYIKAIHEIRERLRCIDRMLANDMAPLLIQEFCQLQLRLAAECLAIASLAATGDFETHKAFRERYEPGAIFKALEVPFPGFFPTPSIMQRVDDGRWYFDGDGHGHAITRDDIEQIWNMSGAHLHRGSAKRYLKDSVEVDLLYITRAKEKFWNLLLDHIVVLSDHTSRFHVHAERFGEDIRCHFLFLDMENGTARVEAYDAAVTLTQ